MPRLPPDLVEDLVDAGSREHYADAPLYDYEYRKRRADIAFYQALAKRRVPPGGRILDLGAGTGRATIPLARDGFRVTALDQSGPMLARLEARRAALPAEIASRISIARGDLRGFELPRQKFPLVIAVFNVLEHLYTRGELDACLRTVKRHLAPGGAFVFDVQVPDLAWLLRDPEKRWGRTRFTDPSTNKQMIYSTNHDYDAVNQIALVRLYYDPADGRGPSRVVKLTQRKFFPAELEALVAHAGYRVTDRFGDFFSTPLVDASESQILVCEPAPIPRRKSPKRR